MATACPAHDCTFPEHAAIRRILQSPAVVDVRPADEFAERARIPGAVHVPMDEILGTGEAKAGRKNFKGYLKALSKAAPPTAAGSATALPAQCWAARCQAGASREPACACAG